MRLRKLITLLLSVGLVGLVGVTLSADAVAHPVDGSADGWILVGQCNEKENWEEWSTGYNRRAVSEILIEAYPLKGRNHLRLQSEVCSYAVRQFNMKDQMTIGKCHKPRDDDDDDDEPSETILYCPNHEMLEKNWMSPSKALIKRAFSLPQSDSKQHIKLLKELAKEYVSDSYGIDQWIAKNPLNGLYISHSDHSSKNHCKWDGKNGRVKGMRIFVKLVSSRHFCPNPPSPKCTGNEIALPISADELVRNNNENKKDLEYEIRSELRKGPIARLNLHRSKCNSYIGKEKFEIFATDQHNNIIALKKSINIKSGPVLFRSLPVSNIQRLSFCSKSSQVWHGYFDYSVLSKTKKWVEYKESKNQLPYPEDTHHDNQKCYGRPISDNDDLVGEVYKRTNQSIHDCLEFRINDKDKSITFLVTQPGEEDNRETAIAARIKKSSDSDSSSSDESSDDQSSFPFSEYFSTGDENPLFTAMVSVTMAALLLVMSIWKTKSKSLTLKRKMASVVHNSDEATVYGSV